MQFNCVHTKVSQIRGLRRDRGRQFLYFLYRSTINLWAIDSTKFRIRKWEVTEFISSGCLALSPLALMIGCLCLLAQGCLPHRRLRSRFRTAEVRTFLHQPFLTQLPFKTCSTPPRPFGAACLGPRGFLSHFKNISPWAKFIEETHYCTGQFFQDSIPPFCLLPVYTIMESCTVLTVDILKCHG